MAFDFFNHLWGAGDRAGPLCLRRVLFAAAFECPDSFTHFFYFIESQDGGCESCYLKGCMEDAVEDVVLVALGLTFVAGKDFHNK